MRQSCRDRVALLHPPQQRHGDGLQAGTRSRTGAPFLDGVEALPSEAAACAASAAACALAAAMTSSTCESQSSGC